MAKLLKIQINIPVNEISTINKVLTSYHHGDLEVDAVLNKRDEIDYNHIKWQGVDLFPLLNNLTQADDIMQMITRACMSYISKLEPFERWQLENYGNILETHMIVGAARHNAFEAWMSKEAELELLNKQNA